MADNDRNGGDDHQDLASLIQKRGKPVDKQKLEKPEQRRISEHQDPLAEIQRVAERSRRAMEALPEQQRIMGFPKNQFIGLAAAIFVVLAIIIVFAVVKATKEELVYEGNEYLGWVKFDTGEKLKVRIDIVVGPLKQRSAKKEVTGTMIVRDYKKMPAVLSEYGETTTFTLNGLMGLATGHMRLKVDSAGAPLSKDIVLNTTSGMTSDLKHERLMGTVLIDDAISGKFEAVRPIPGKAQTPD